MSGDVQLTLAIVGSVFGSLALFLAGLGIGARDRARLANEVTVARAMNAGAITVSPFIKRQLDDMQQGSGGLIKGHDAAIRALLIMLAKTLTPAEMERGLEIATANGVKYTAAELAQFREAMGEVPDAS